MALIVAFREELGMGERFKFNHDLLRLRRTAEALLRNLGENDEDDLAKVKAEEEYLWHAWMERN